MTSQTNEKRRSGRPKQPVSKETILKEATTVFAENGYAGASMNEMAERVGLRKASLFHHFPTKETLYEAVWENALGQLGLLIANVEMPSDSFVEQLDHLGDTLVHYLGENPTVARLLIREMVEGNRFSKGPIGETILTILGATVHFLESGMESGAIARQDPRQLLLSIVGLHLTYFATAELSSALVGEDVFSPKQIEARSREVRRQVRRMCSVG